MTPKILFTTIAVLTALGSPALARDQQEIDRDFPAAGLLRVDASVAIGSLRVEAGSADGVHIHAVRWADGGTAEERRRWLSEDRLEVDRAGDTVIVKETMPHDRNERHTSHGFRIGTDVTVRMPARLAARANCGVGSIDVSGLGGDVTAHSGVGHVRLTSLEAAGHNVEAHTGVGEINLAGSVGDLSVNSGVGKVFLTGVRCSGHKATVHAGMGDVALALAAVPADRLDVHVGMGKARVTLPAGAGADVSAHSGSGRIVSGIAGVRVARHEFGPSGSASGAINGGGVRVSVDVGMGDVDLEQQ